MLLSESGRRPGPIISKSWRKVGIHCAQMNKNRMLPRKPVVYLGIRRYPDRPFDICRTGWEVFFFFKFDESVNITNE